MGDEKGAMKPSEASAARFLALQASKSKLSRAAAGERLRRGRLQAAAARLCVDDRWRYIAKHVPDALLAWARDVGLDPSTFVLGITGKPPRVVAVDRGCYEPGYTRCRCHSFREGRWRPMCHPPIVNGSSKDCDVCDVPCVSCHMEGG